MNQVPVGQLRHQLSFCRWCLRYFHQICIHINMKVNAGWQGDSARYPCSFAHVVNRVYVATGEHIY